MAAALELSVETRGRGFGRWLGAAVLIVGIHVSGVAIGMVQWRDPPGAPAPLPPAIMIDLQPVAATPPPPPPTAAPEKSEAIVERTDLPEAEVIPPEAVELPPLAELLDLPPPLPEVTPEVEVPAKKAEKEKAPEKKDKKKDKKKEKKDKKEKKEARKKDDKKKPEKPEVVAQAKIVADKSQDQVFRTAGDTLTKTNVEVTQPAQQASLPAGPSAADHAATQAARASWEGLILSHLEKFKKYPRVAKRRNQEGMPVVAFVIDRAGYLKNTYLVQSSGHESLDEEALATLRRAEPLPAVPPEVTGATISRSVPIRFNLKD